MTDRDIQQLLEMMHELVNKPAQRWLTISQACIYAGKKSRNTLKQMISEGKISGFKDGNDWIVDKLSIDKYFLSKISTKETVINKFRGKMNEALQKR